FNGSSGCAAAVQSPPTCADAIARANEQTLIPSLAAPGLPSLLAVAVLEQLGTENATNSSSLRWAGSVFLAESSGISAPWLDQLWTRFPSGTASAPQLASWAAAIVANGTLATYPLPVPRPIL
ncbi:MAG: hypothetical protein L3K07_09080, partial [Thermoplasmata archaeon]|nr:hypothetical protein [Thermoplasmata archaeon]